ncbi:hypothetical protein [Streptomyces sp. JJ36]|uniref:hypothetical protein n=1 Tax=Streptomyces sp. JJ36 TaxID=2736645 RepID=UPI001F318C9C|nr:hypothetical protein [Streptomyces sp. JJ36]MCF6524203.1 hypothetical protein [Streptomyces sp. JJ36]
MRDEDDGSNVSGGTAAPATEEEAHLLSTVERGAFAHASCSCGWRGPARRARDRARADGAAHLPE